MKAKDFAEQGNRHKIEAAIRSLVGLLLPIRYDGSRVSYKYAREVLEAAGLEDFDMAYDHLTGEMEIIPYSWNRGDKVIKSVRVRGLKP